MINGEKQAQEKIHTDKRFCSPLPNNNQDHSAQAVVLFAGKKARLQERGERTDKNRAEPGKVMNDKHTLVAFALP